MHMNDKSISKKMLWTSDWQINFCLQCNTGKKKICDNHEGIKISKKFPKQYLTNNV